MCALHFRTHTNHNHSTGEYHHPDFTDVGIEVQRGQMTSPRCHRCKWQNKDLNPGHNCSGRWLDSPESTYPPELRFTSEALLNAMAAAAERLGPTSVAAVLSAIHSPQKEISQQTPVCDS